MIREHVALHGWICPGYGRAAHPAERLTGDHRTPVSMGGLSERSNVDILCLSCNDAKGDSTSSSSPMERGVDLKAGGAGSKTHRSAGPRPRSQPLALRTSLEVEYESETRFRIA